MSRARDTEDMQNLLRRKDDEGSESLTHYQETAAAMQRESTFE